ncbi:MAG: hypothetical protein COA80_13725 [Leeuwenhoekiella sp.]|nr:MAG: hypothetical protein COA80_13725 [Leeuwenhoekiella sp.]
MTDSPIFTTLKAEFQKALETTPIKKMLIQRELSAIENFINGNGRHVRAGIIRTIDFSHIQSVINLQQIRHHRNNEFLKMMDSLYTNGTIDKSIIDSDSFLSTSYMTETIEFARGLFQYYSWLQDIENEKPKPKKYELTHKQKMLALHYLGLDLSQYDNTKSAKILSLILDLDEGNTRKYLSYVAAGKNDVRTKSNLKKLNEVFKHQGLDDIAFTIKNDLDKIS